MNKKYEFCTCETKLIRISAQDHIEKISLGYYCKKCKRIFDLDFIPFFNYKEIALTEPDPRVGFIRKIYPDGDFMYYLDKLHYNRCTCKIPETITDPDISLEDRLKRDHAAFMAPENSIQVSVRKDEIKEVASNQEMFIK